MPFHPAIEEWDAGLVAGDPLRFPGYEQRRLALAESGESVRTGRTEHYAFVEGRFDVLGGSMGLAAGEKVVRAYDRATAGGLPMVLHTKTGGARLQEGMLALIQMARTAAAAERHAAAGLLSVAVYGTPTTGGVLASYASLADVRAAMAGALVGFAGPRVAEGTLGITLPPGSPAAEHLYDNGLIDALLGPDEVAPWLEGVLGLVDWPLPKRRLPAWEDPVAIGTGTGGAWAEVLRSRASGRPTGIDRAAEICSSWVELRSTDPTLRAGLARVAGRRCVVVASDRHHGLGRPTVPGYRLAQRAVRLAGRLGWPVVSLVDTPGADPSPASEAEGIAPEIARTLADFAACPTATVAVCVGEGGSGGALALSHADRLLVNEHAIYSVIGPEGAAAILERDVSKAPEVAERLRLTSADLVDLGLVDEIVGEDETSMRDAVARALDTAVVGDRDRRLDAASRRWLVER